MPLTITCLHRGGPLGEGALEGKIVTCPWHGWQYDVTTGKTTMNPNAGVPCYATKCVRRSVVDNWIERLSITIDMNRFTPNPSWFDSG